MQEAERFLTGEPLLAGLQGAAAVAVDHLGLLRQKEDLHASPGVDAGGEIAVREDKRAVQLNAEQLFHGRFQPLRAALAEQIQQGYCLSLIHILIRVGTVNVSEGWMPYSDSGVPVIFLTDESGTLLHWLAFPGEDGAFWLDGVRLCQMDGASWELFRAAALSA